MTEPNPWWRNAVVYQVYVRSFADGNGDGTGDIAGLRSRLPYVRSLGVDAIWVNPWYLSPMHDGGYDVSDYRTIDPLFGTIEEARHLIAEAAALGLRVIVDLVPNHTSSEHKWFKEALTAPSGSRERARYHFRPGKGKNGTLPPNNWRSVFGGPAWTRLTDGEWYLHLFDPTQPDLNWDNPEVHDEFKQVIRFWLDMGAAGFRVDVAHGLVKDTTYPDVAEASDTHLETPFGENSPMWDRPGIHAIVREWRSVLDEYPDTVMVAEAWVPSWDRLARYVRPGEYHQAFDFDFLVSPWNAAEMRLRIDTALNSTKAVGSVPTWVLSNHDVVRQATRYGLPPGIKIQEWLLGGDRSLLDEQVGLRRARAAALLMLALPGSVYLYQGEELGLGEVYDLPIAVLDDPVWERSGHKTKGRDGCRVPIPWDAFGPSLGFGEGPAWLPQPPTWGDLSVAEQDGLRGSTLELYRQALRIRKDRAIGAGGLEWLDHGKGIISFRTSGRLTCMVNLGDEPIPIPAGTVLLASGPLPVERIPSDTAVWLL